MAIIIIIIEVEAFLVFLDQIGLNITGVTILLFNRFIFN